MERRVDPRLLTEVETAPTTVHGESEEGVQRDPQYEVKREEPAEAKRALHPTHAEDQDVS